MDDREYTLSQLRRVRDDQETYHFKITSPKGETRWQTISAKQFELLTELLLSDRFNEG